MIVVLIVVVTGDLIVYDENQCILYTKIRLERYIYPLAIHYFIANGEFIKLGAL